MKCGVTSTSQPSFNYFNRYKSSVDFYSCFLRTYRLAVAATIEYTTFQGGPVDALAAQVVTINRVNGVYEVDVGVTYITDYRDK